MLRSKLSHLNHTISDHEVSIEINISVTEKSKFVPLTPMERLKRFKDQINNKKCLSMLSFKDTIAYEQYILKTLN
jgi:hypothetical protein